MKFDTGTFLCEIELAVTMIQWHYVRLDSTRCGVTKMDSVTK